jgi:hypothetical protein
MIELGTFEKLEAIDDRSWGRIYKELVRYAEYKLNKAGFEIRTEKDSVDAEHFATTAIEKVFDGTRRWDFVRYPDITIHLKGIVKSLISSHFKTSSHSIVYSGIQADNTLIAGDEGSEFLNYVTLEAESPAIESAEEIIINAEKWTIIEKAFGNSTNDYIIFSEWLDGSPPKLIGESFEISVIEVNNAIKRGKRIVKSLYAKNS